MIHLHEKDDKKFNVKVLAVEVGCYLVFVDNIPVFKSRPLSGTLFFSSVRTGDEIHAINDKDISKLDEHGVIRLLEKAQDEEGYIKLNLVRPLECKVSEVIMVENSVSSVGVDYKEEIESFQDVCALQNDSYAHQVPDRLRKIGIAVNVQRIMEVQTNTSSFRASLLLDIEWQPLASEIKTWNKLTPMERDSSWRPEWTPTIHLDNAIAMDRRELRENQFGQQYHMFKRGERDFQGVIASTKYEYLIQIRILINATFHEDMELQNFPFDVQTLTISISEGHSNLRSVLVPHFRRWDFVEVHPEKSSILGWEFMRPISQFTCTSPSSCGFGRSYSALVIEMKIKRKPKYFLSRISSTLAVLGFSTLLAFIIPLDELADRLAHIVTLLLTTVAFQFVVQSQLPQVDYSTLADWHADFNFYFMAMIGTYSAVVVLIEQESDMDVEYLTTYDRLFLIIFFALWFVFHILLIIYVRCIVYRREINKLLTLQSRREAPNNNNIRSGLPWKTNAKQQWVKGQRNKYGLTKKEAIYLAH